MQTWNRTVRHATSIRHVRAHDILLLMLAGLLLAACNTQHPTEQHAMHIPDIRDITSADLRILENRKYYFMHQSIGDNILDGVERLANRIGKKAAIHRLDGNTASLHLKGPGFWHAYGGKNGKPLSKIDAFVAQMDRLGKNGSMPDVAMMKFCYLDFSASTDPEAVLDAYSEALKNLQSRFPDTRFVHMTAPIMATPTDFRSRLKRLLGMSIWQDETNIVRNRYNTLLRETYPARDIFDIAAIESLQSMTGEPPHVPGHPGVPALAPQLTYDGGHLNDAGREYAAVRFLEFLHTLQ